MTWYEILTCSNNYSHYHIGCEVIVNSVVCMPYLKLNCGNLNNLADFSLDSNMHYPSDMLSDTHPDLVHSSLHHS